YADVSGRPEAESDRRAGGIHPVIAVEAGNERSYGTRSYYWRSDRRSAAAEEELPEREQGRLELDDHGRSQADRHHVSGRDAGSVSSRRGLRAAGAAGVAHPRSQTVRPPNHN